MMISTRGRYALRVMLDLAEHCADGYIPLKEIAHRQDISEKYLEIVLKVLVRNNLLTGLRGKGGGYRLTPRPRRVHFGRDSAPDRRQPGAGGLRRRGQHGMPPPRDLPVPARVAEAGHADQRLSGWNHAGRSAEIPIAAAAGPAPYAGGPSEHGRTAAQHPIPPPNNIPDSEKL